MIKLRTDISLEELKAALKKETNVKVYRRLLGIIEVLEGGSRREAEDKAQLSMNIFRKWIVRFNESGISGLKSIKQTGRPAKINEEVGKALKEVVIKGPNEEDGIVRYRLVDLQKYLKTEHGISIAVSGVWEALDSMGITWKTGRQRHPQSNEEVQEVFKKNFVKK